MSQQQQQQQQQQEEEEGIAAEKVCYVHCNFCNTVLAVSVPSSSMFTMVTVRCGYCSNLLSVNMGNNAPPPLLPNRHHHQAPSLESATEKEKLTFGEERSNNNINNNNNKGCGSASLGSPSHSKYSSSSKNNEVCPPLDTIPTPSSFDSWNWMDHPLDQPPTLPPIPPPEKRQRVPSAYNRFIKEEIQRIKASNPEISHREAFSTAAKNWAHFPHINFGLKFEGKKQKQAKHGDHPHHIHHPIGTTDDDDNNN